MSYIGKFYAVAPVMDLATRIGWAVVVVSDEYAPARIIYQSKSKKACSKVAHEMNEGLEASDE